jgi:transcriptional antiterminator NusG
MSDIQKKFYVLRAISGKENKVREYLEAELKNTDLGEYVSQVLIPTEKTFTIRNGKKVMKERAYLPGYVLVEAVLVGEVAHRLRNIPNVIGFLGGSDNPVPLRPAEVNRILGTVDELQEQQEDLDIQFYVGENVKITFGPFNGFIGEFLIYVGLLLSLKMDTSGLFILIILSIAGLALVGTLALLCFTKIFSITFLGLPRSEYSEHVQSDVSKSMLIPMGVLATMTIIIGLFAFVFFKMVISAISQFIDIQYFYAGFISVLELLINILVCFTILILVLFFVFGIRKLICRKYVVFNTWGCGYDKGNNHIQYTASSFVGPFSSIMTPLFKKIFDVKKPKGLFPKDAHYNSSIEDVEEAYLINPIVKFDEKFLSKFERLQDGNIQHYILYGLIFLILALVGVVFLG